MVYVPGFRNDVFVSYAHGDDDPPLTPDGRGWVAHFRDHLGNGVRARLGLDPKIWIDKRDLRPDVDFDKEIHDQLDAAVLILVASPTYVTSDYCRKERNAFLKITSTKHATRFRKRELANANFIFKVVSLTDDGQAHRRILPDLNLSDVLFCEKTLGFYRRLAIATRDFNDAVEELSYKVSSLLTSMRGKCPAVFLWPSHPESASGLSEPRERLANELSDASFRVLPELALDPEAELRQAKLPVFLVGSELDEETRELALMAARRAQPWVVWRASGGAPMSEDLLKGAEVLDANSRLSEEVLAILRRPERPPAEKKRVYVVYNREDPEEAHNATFVVRTIAREFDVDEPGAFSTHKGKLGKSDGVLIVWGTAKPDWYAPNFDDMCRLARRARSQGVCFFNPRDDKNGEIRKLRGFSDLYLIEQFNGFDPAKLDPFLAPLRGPTGRGA